jgi:CIC family chloride channel protein
MGALFAAATHAPITAILLVFEMTNNYRIIPALMISSVIAFLLSSWIHPNSIYQDQLKRRGFRQPQTKSLNILKGETVAHAFDNDVTIVRPSDSFASILSAFLASPKPALVVVNESEHYEGNIEFNDIREFIPHSHEVSPAICAVDIMNREIPFVLPTDTLDVVMHLFGQNNCTIIATVNNPKERKFIGVVSRASIMENYNKQLFDRELSDGFESIVSTVKGNRSIEVLGNIYMSEIHVKAYWIGKSIKTLNLRAKYGLEVLLIHKTGSTTGIENREGIFPTPDTILQLGDKLLVMGEKEKIRHFTGEAID